jgi:hypothetical protein
MCSQDKISYHFAVSNFAFSAKTCMGLCAIIRQGQIWERFVDTGVYKSIQCIRLEGSTKFGEQRWKIRAGICPEGENRIYDVSAFAPFHTSSSCFEAKANTSNRANARECLLLSDLRDACVPDVSCSVVYNECSLAKARGPFVHDASLLDHFEVRRACNRTVFLKRIKPGFCSQCNRVHNKENAMVKYDRYGRQRFVCWRFVFRSC